MRNKGTRRRQLTGSSCQFTLFWCLFFVSSGHISHPFLGFFCKAWTGKYWWSKIFQYKLALNFSYHSQGKAIYCKYLRPRNWKRLWDYDMNVPAGNYMFKVNNRNTRTRYEMCSKLTIKISLLLTLNIFNTLF